ncbi:acyl-CoA thioesterase [Aquirhabdus sp.]|uniref:acyl-CoA thioesterase n=1 Tax=Aquirhabdus sp. TaxID=2824160 RepID=UPI00396CF4CD
MNNQSSHQATATQSAVFQKIYTVQPADIDGLGHMNNTVYLKLMEDLAWSHSNVLGITVEDFQRLGYAMVAREHHMTYLAALFPNEQVQMETWLDNNNALNLHRYYRFTRLSDQKLAFEGHTHWVCIAIDTGRPHRMPPEFKVAYGVK